MAKYTIYGIKNCDTMKKAFTYLKDAGIDYDFVDYAKQKPTREDLARWREAFGELPANRQGPTFRKIKEAYDAADESGREDLLLANTSAIKRPILEGGTTILKGFDPAQWPKA